LVNAANLRDMFYESLELIRLKKDYLNQINVFPVPDGDTGANIEMTMSKIIEEIKKLDRENNNYGLKDIATAISEGAFKGAKGNSGVILSQFFEGFTNVIGLNSILSPEIFANALLEGSKLAYEAVLNPQEGTILTVTRKVGENCIEFVKNNPSWSETLINVFKTAQIATKETPNDLKDLRNSGVVDSGALAFVYIVEGWMNIVLKESDVLDIDDNILQEMEKLHNTVNIQETTDNLQFRYCTEAFITQVNGILNEVKTELSSMGDSFMLIDIGKDKDYKMKLHIHTNQPFEVIEKFTKHGILHSVKIDDMLQQTIDAHE
jgi:uncharacterized protein